MKLVSGLKKASYVAWAGFAIAMMGCGGSSTKNTLDDTATATGHTAATAPVDSAAYKGMVLIKGGSFQMGSNDPDFNDTRPIHTVKLKDLWMDAHEVTNAEFKKFVDATGYKTVAEQELDPK